MLVLACLLFLYIFVDLFCSFHWTYIHTDRLICSCRKKRTVQLCTVPGEYVQYIWMYTKLFILRSYSVCFKYTGFLALWLPTDLNRLCCATSGSSYRKGGPTLAIVSIMGQTDPNSSHDRTVFAVLSVCWSPYSACIYIPIYVWSFCSILLFKLYFTCTSVEQYVPGIYAVSVSGELPVDIVESLKDQGKHFVARDRSTKA
jgi:hypothetical protein